MIQVSVYVSGLLCFSGVCAPILQGIIYSHFIIVLPPYCSSIWILEWACWFPLHINNDGVCIHGGGYQHRDQHSVAGQGTAIAWGGGSRVRISCRLGCTKKKPQNPNGLNNKVYFSLKPHVHPRALLIVVMQGPKLTCESVVSGPEEREPDKPHTGS